MKKKIKKNPIILVTTITFIIIYTIIKLLKRISHKCNNQLCGIICGIYKCSGLGQIN